MTSNGHHPTPAAEPGPPPNTTDLSIGDDQQSWTPAQLDALARLGVQGAAPGELALLFHHAKRSGLDPFARQIYLIGRFDAGRGRTSWTVQTGIDGFRVIARRAADRTGEDYAYEDTMWCGPDGQWSDVWLADRPPAAAKVTVLRAGRRFSAAATFTEYAATRLQGDTVVLSGQWASKPAVMIAKCAEALALRKAFPQDLSGLYTSEEMEQAGNPAVAPRTEPPRPAPPSGVTADGDADIDAMPTEPGAEPDWRRLVADCSSAAQCRALYRRAAEQGAPPLVATLLIHRAQQLSDPSTSPMTGTDGEPDSIDAGDPTLTGSTDGAP